MDDLRVRQFFELPKGTLPRRYEAFRAFFVESASTPRDRRTFRLQARCLESDGQQVFAPAATKVTLPPFSIANRRPIGSGDALATTPNGPEAPRPPIAVDPLARRHAASNPSRRSVFYFCRC